jgi:salicylate hydroxylase
MALEDAWVLTRTLATDPEEADALAAYAAVRRPRCARIVAAAEENAANYHLRPGPLRFAAHTALRLAAADGSASRHGPLRWLHGHDVTRA